MQTYKKRIIVETEYVGANVSCISTKKGLVLIDSPFFSKDAKDWARRIREQTGQDIAYLINTDHHYDHVMGNAFLTDNVICHSTAAKGLSYLRNKEVLREVIQDAFPDYMDEIESDIDKLDIVSPLMTFDKRMTLDMGDATIILEFVGGHSPGTILTYLVEEKAIFAGDNVEAQFPYFGQARFKDWKETLWKILSMDIDVVVPGHGPVGGSEMVEKYSSFFEKLEEEVKDFDVKGLTIEEMVEKSDIINFFPEDEISREDLRQSWRGEQYRAAARAILAEKEQKEM